MRILDREHEYKGAGGVCEAANEFELIKYLNIFEPLKCIKPR